VRAWDNGSQWAVCDHASASAAASGAVATGAGLGDGDGRVDSAVVHLLVIDDVRGAGSIPDLHVVDDVYRVPDEATLRRMRDPQVLVSLRRLSGVLRVDRGTVAA